MPTLFNNSARRRNTYIKKSPGIFSGRDSFRPEPNKDDWHFLKLDMPIAFIVCAFVLSGLIFTYSSSAFDSTSFFTRQLVFDIIGVSAALFLSQFYSKLIKVKFLSPAVLLGISWVLLVIVLFSREQANVHRWIDLGFFKVQPSEIAKVTLVIYIAHYLDSVTGKIAKNIKLLFKPIIVAGITLALILAEKDIGTPTLMGVAFLFMLIIAGMTFKQFLKFSACLAPFAIGLAVHQLFMVDYRRRRIMIFLDPFSDLGGDGYQLGHSLYAVASGGWFGKGIGNSELKLEYLPAAHTDFIFSVMCEELGLFIGTIILGFFCWFLCRGIALACVAKKHVHAYTIFGLTITICMQAFFNMAMAIGLLPTKGIAFPFYSYGGSSVIMTLAMVGIIFNLAAVDNTQKNLRQDISQYKNRNK